MLYDIETENLNKQKYVEDLGIKRLQLNIVTPGNFVKGFKTNRTSFLYLFYFISYSIVRIVIIYYEILNKK